RIVQLAAKIRQEREHYNALVQNQKLYRDTYVYILILMTVLILFAAVWIGLFLSKRITVPIEALSEATREISAGNLDHRVHVQAQDELGLLVRLFNDMAGQLQATTRELEARRRYMEIILESIPTGVISVDPDLRVNKINRPVTRIQLSAERIARIISRLAAASPRVATVIEECVAAIVEEVSSLKHLVDEFVRFARLPAVSRVPNSMKELVDRTMALYE